MMASIRLSLEGDEGIPLVARIYPADGTESQAAEVGEVVVPVIGETAVQVPPGSYLVTLLLPSGSTLRQACTVHADGVAEVAFDARGKLSSGLEEGDTFSLTGALSEIPPDDLAGLERVVVAQARPAELEPTVGSKVVFKTRKPAYGTSGRSEAEAVGLSNRGLREADATAIHLVDGSNFQADGGWSAFINVTSVRRLRIRARLEPTPGSGAVVSTFDGLPQGCTRAWARVVGTRGTEIAAVPLPWRGDPSPIALSVEPPSAGRAATDVAVQDDTVGGLLTYLDQGRMSLVATLLRSLEESGAIERSIYGERRSPLSACAAGYGFLAIFSADRMDRWERWLVDLVDLHASIPDCHVLLARYRTLQRGAEHTSAAGAALTAATAAGIPFYSTGLLMLRDMLSAGAARSDHQQGLLDAVAPVAARCDPTRLFTVLRYPRQEVAG